MPVSDARAGATVYPRDLLLTGLADALPVWLKAGNRVLLTSRPYGLDEDGLRKLGLPQAPLEPLPEPLRNLFVARWFHALGKAEQSSGLIATIRERDDLGPLAENPMMLTAVCVLWDNGGRLPEDLPALLADRRQCAVPPLPGRGAATGAGAGPARGDRPRHACGRPSVAAREPGGRD